MTFVSWHGRGDYSIEYSLKDIMLSYAYDPSNQSYPFLKILKELKNQDIEPSSVKSLAVDTQSVQTSYDTTKTSNGND